jgi:hypothetical protein
MARRSTGEQVTTNARWRARYLHAVALTILLAACSSKSSGEGGGGKQGSGIDGEELCDLACSCNGCSDAERQECVSGLETLEVQAAKAECETELGDVAECWEKQGECVQGSLELPDECYELTEDLSDCVDESGAGGGPSSSSASATTSSAASTSGPTTTSNATTGGPMTCDDLGTCDACGSCAMEGACADELSTCQSNPACLDLYFCIEPCTTQSCIDSCASQYPGGIADLDTVVSCVVCGQCPLSCDAAGSGC